MLKKEGTVTSFSPIIEPWMETKFGENIRIEANVQRQLSPKASMQFFHLSSQMSLPSWLTES